MKNLKEFASTLVRDKFRKNDIVVITPESMKFWIESETKALSFYVEKKLEDNIKEKWHISLKKILD